MHGIGNFSGELHNLIGNEDPLDKFMLNANILALWGPFIMHVQSVGSSVNCRNGLLFGFRLECVTTFDNSPQMKNCMRACATKMNISCPIAIRPTFDLKFHGPRSSRKCLSTSRDAHVQVKHRLLYRFHVQIFCFRL